MNRITRFSKSASLVAVGLFVGLVVGFMGGLQEVHNLQPEYKIRKVYQTLPAVCLTIDNPESEPCFCAQSVQFQFSNDTVDVDIVATVTNFDEIQDLVKKEAVNNFKRHSVFGLVGVGPSGIKVNIDEATLKASEEFGPVIGGGYKFSVDESLGVGVWGLSNFTFGATVSWDF